MDIGDRLLEFRHEYSRQYQHTQQHQQQQDDDDDVSLRIKHADAQVKSLLADVDQKSLAEALTVRSIDTRAKDLTALLAMLFRGSWCGVRSLGRTNVRRNTTHCSWGLVCTRIVALPCCMRVLSCGLLLFFVLLLVRGTFDVDGSAARRVVCWLVRAADGWLARLLVRACDKLHV